jgi:hypothetical protein
MPTPYKVIAGPPVVAPPTAPEGSGPIPASGSALEQLHADVKLRCEAARAVFFKFLDDPARPYDWSETYQRLEGRLDKLRDMQCDLEIALGLDEQP